MRPILSSLLFGTTLALAACSGGQAQEPGNQQTASAATRAPVGARTHGFVKIVGEALGEVPLRPDQRAELEKMATEADARHEAMRQSRVAILEALAAQIEKGTIDRAALQPKIDAAVESWERARPADRAALQRMHDLLDASQRAAFVDALRARLHHAHDRGAAFGHMREWATDLKLTQPQRDELKSKLKEEFYEHHGERGHAFEDHPHPGKVLEAFKEDAFKIDEVAPPVDAKLASRTMTDRLVRMAEIALPVLTAEQRGIAAKKIRERSDVLLPAPH